MKKCSREASVSSNRRLGFGGAEEVVALGVEVA